MARTRGRVLLAALAGSAAAGYARAQYLHDIERAQARIASGSALAETARGRIEHATAAATKLARDALVRSILATPPALLQRADRDERERVERMLAEILPVSARRDGLMNDAAVCASLPRYELERITAPTLAISFADDLYGTYERAKYTSEHIPYARFLGYESGGHVFVGRERDVRGEIAAFLSA